MRFSICLIITLFLSLSSESLAEDCGIQAGGALCPGGLCCSEWGWCGSTSTYCGDGCQSQCTATECGTQAGGKLCPNGLCCSEWGGCGNTSAYCGEGCQSQCTAAQCGTQAGGALCQDGLCCSEWGFCGNTAAYCGEGCQNQCGGGSNDTELSRLIPRSTFDEFFKYQNDPRCPSLGFYAYDAFIEAAKSFPDFANTSDEAINKREIAAFLAQTSHETTGGWPSAPDGPYAWGYCFIKEVGGDLLPPDTYCNPNYPCPKSYYGRGPIQLSWNYNYIQCGTDIKEDLLNNPDLLATNALLSFKSAFWFWMTAQPPKPSCHDVIIEKWEPSPADLSANRLPGYGVTTNIINGGIECGHGPNDKVADRIGFYKKYCDTLGVGYGNNLDCYNQVPFGSGVSSLMDM